jgi:hypothetical protein
MARPAWRHAALDITFLEEYIFFKTPTGGFMANPKKRRITVDTGRFYVLSPILPYVDIICQSTAINRREFIKIVDLAASYPNDPRMIEMVRKGGDASAKVPYLMEEGETPDSILTILREIAGPYVDRIHRMPAPVQATIHLLLSINTVPRGCEMFGIPALLEMDRIQGEMVRALHGLMSGRQLARDFHNNNIAALQMLDRDWVHLREMKDSRWLTSPLPDHSQMQYQPYFDKADRLVYLHETCIIVDPPGVSELQRFTPPVLQSPLPPNVPAPTTGSADWLIRAGGKIGRHFTRALLGIINARLAAERIPLEAENYDLINQRALDALQKYVEKTP